jgi:hypothetical protein
MLLASTTFGPRGEREWLHQFSRGRRLGEPRLADSPAIPVSSGEEGVEMKINVRCLLMLISSAVALLMVSSCAQQPIVAAAVGRP